MRSITRKVVVENDGSRVTKTTTYSSDSQCLWAFKAEIEAICPDLLGAKPEAKAKGREANEGRGA